MNNITTPSSGSLGLRLARRWYAIAAPPEVPKDAPFKDREVVRRGQRASWILLVIILLVIAPIPGAINKPSVFVILLVVLALNLLALFLNRMKRPVIAAFLVIFTIEMGIVGAVSSMPGGMSPTDVALLDTLTQAELVGVALLAPGWVFAIMLLNIAVVVGVLSSHIPSPELAHLLAINGSNIFIQAIEIQIIMAIFSFILVRSADLAIKSLDRAEEIAALERKEIERQEEQLVLKRQLETGIEQILQTYVRAANGDFRVRAPLAKDNVLWKVAYSLNNLISRLERYNQSEAEIKRTKEAIHRLAGQIHKAKETGQTMQFQQTGTPVDEVVVALITSKPTRSQSLVMEESAWQPSSSFGRESSFQRQAFSRKE
jgi:hypothetical protein